MLGFSPVPNRLFFHIIFDWDCCILYKHECKKQALGEMVFSQMCHLETASSWWPPPNSRRGQPFQQSPQRSLRFPTMTCAASSLAWPCVRPAGLCRQEGGLGGVPVLCLWENGRQPDCRNPPCPGSLSLGVLQPPWKATSPVSEIVPRAPLLLSSQVQLPINFWCKTYSDRCLAEPWLRLPNTLSISHTCFSLKQLFFFRTLFLSVWPPSEL